MELPCKTLVSTIKLVKYKIILTVEDKIQSYLVVLP